MDSRERTLLSLEHETGDRIPIDFWASMTMKRRLAQEFECSYDAFLDKYDVDLRYIEGPAYIGPARPDKVDIWGVRRTAVVVSLDSGSESYSEVDLSPLADADSAEAVDSYPGWPSPDWFDYSVVEAQCEAVRNQGRVAVFMGDRLNRIAQLKPAMYLRGMEHILMDLHVNPDIARAILGRVRKFYTEYLDRILDAAKGKLDIVLTGDDFGGQQSLLVSLDTWRGFLGEGFKQYIDIIHSYGVKCMHHTCGSVSDLVPDLINCGLDVLQSLQPEAAGMNLAELKARFGKDLCFQGGISIQEAMPFGSPHDVRKAVEHVADVVKPNGGYIFCTAHNIQADTSTENVTALLEAYHQYGRYE